MSVLSHRSPKGMGPPIDFEKDLIQMPFVTTARTVTTQFIGIHLPKFQTPLSHGFIGHDDPALGHKLLNIAKTEGEAEIPPHRVADDFRWR